jgi:hypothetical protein
MRRLLIESAVYWRIETVILQNSAAHDTYYDILSPNQYFGSVTERYTNVTSSLALA